MVAAALFVFSTGTTTRAWQVTSDAAKTAEEAKKTAEEAKKTAEEAKKTAEEAKKAQSGTAGPVKVDITFSDKGDLDFLLTELKEQGWRIEDVNDKKITATLPKDRKPSKRAHCPHCHSTATTDRECHEHSCPAHCPHCGKPAGAGAAHAAVNPPPSQPQYVQNGGEAQYVPVYAPPPASAPYAYPQSYGVPMHSGRWRLFGR
jgi:hypothetical protein